MILCTRKTTKQSYLVLYFSTVFLPNTCSKCWPFSRLNCVSSMAINITWIISLKSVNTQEVLVRRRLKWRSFGEKCPVSEQLNIRAWKPQCPPWTINYCLYGPKKADRRQVHSAPCHPQHRLTCRSQLWKDTQDENTRTCAQLNQVEEFALCLVRESSEFSYKLDMGKHSTRDYEHTLVKVSFQKKVLIPYPKRHPHIFIY